MKAPAKPPLGLKLTIPASLVDSSMQVGTKNTNTLTGGHELGVISAS